jgi:hypothetical protein
MRISPAITLNREQQAKLEQYERSRSLPARLVERARFVLLIAEARVTGISCISGAYSDLARMTLNCSPVHTVLEPPR